MFSLLPDNFLRSHIFYSNHNFFLSVYLYHGKGSKIKQIIDSKFSKSAAKLLLYTAKTCQYLRKDEKTVIFFHFLPKHLSTFFLFLF